MDQPGREDTSPSNPAQEKPPRPHVGAFPVGENRIEEACAMLGAVVCRWSGPGRDWARRTGGSLAKRQAEWLPRPAQALHTLSR